MEVASLADLLHETAEQHDAFEKVAPPHDWWDWYAAYMDARQGGSNSDEASDANRIVLTTTDSNGWADGPSHTYTLKREPDGKTEIDYVVVRDGKNLKGRFLGIVLATVGKGRLDGAFEKFIKAVEARDNGATPAESS